MQGKVAHRLQRKRRIRAKIRGVAARPRLSVYRSLRALSVQLIDDDTSRTLVASSTRELKEKGTREGAEQLGTSIAKKAKAAGITAVVFDRNAYRYHGQVKALADAARKGGLQF